MEPAVLPTATCQHSTNARLKSLLSPQNWLSWAQPGGCPLTPCHQRAGGCGCGLEKAQGVRSNSTCYETGCSRIFISRKEHLGGFSRGIRVNLRYPPYIGFHQDCSRLHIYIRKQNNSYLGAISNSSMKKHHVTKQFTIQNSSKSNI